MKNLYETYKKLNECQERHFDESEVMKILAEDKIETIKEFAQAAMQEEITDCVQFSQLVQEFSKKLRAEADSK